MLEIQLERFYVYLKGSRNCSPHTVKAYQGDLNEFKDFLVRAGIKDFSSVDKFAVRKYLLELNRRHLAKNSVIRKVSALKSFFKFLVNQNIIPAKILLHLYSPKKENKVPVFLSEQETEKIIDLPSDASFAAVRMKCILEVLYSTGIRIEELVNLNLGDVDLLGGMVKVFGKGGKERYVPVGDRACDALKQYLDARKKISPSSPSVFVNLRGGRLTARGIRKLLKNWLSAAAINKKITPHTFRHTFATHMLERGCDLKSIQEMLGHSSLTTTQIYTHYTVDRLKKIYEKAHRRK